MTWPGQRAVRDRLRDRQDDLEQALFTQAVVTAVASNSVTVRQPGASDVQSWPRLKSYSAPAVGEVVLMAGRPGSWVVLGALA